MTIRSRLGRYKRRLYNVVDRPALVLLYHRVTTLERDPQLLSVTPGNFYAQVSCLKKEFNLLTPDEFLEIITNKKKFPPNTAIITFDDGYADNFLEALPILENLNAEAIFYITTSKLGTDNELWWDELERLLFESDQLPATLEMADGEVTRRYSLVTAADKQLAYDSLHPILKYSTPTRRDQLIFEMQKATKGGSAGRPTHRLLTREELVNLSKSSSAVVGAHTHNHPALSVLRYEEQMEEIQTSRAVLENLLNEKIKHFSYPYGEKADFNQDTILACEELGFDMVCANYYGHVHRWTNRYQIPRVLVRDWDETTFRQKMATFFRS